MLKSRLFYIIFMFFMKLFHNSKLYPIGYNLTDFGGLIPERV